MSPNAPRKGHGIGSRGRRLRALPYWDEIEIRLQHGWSPEKAADWYERTYSPAKAPSRATLYRYLEDKPKSWFLSPLVLEQIENAHVSRVLVLQRHAELCEAMKMRLTRAGQTEATMNGLLYPEWRANAVAYGQMLRDHLTMEQELGFERKATQSSKEPGGGDDADARNTRELHDLVGRIVNLPTEEFLPALEYLLGPPPVKQPIQIEGTVVESRPLTEEERSS